MTSVLATLMKSRGTDATGVCTVSPKGRVELRKEPRAADVFLAGRKGIGRSAQTALIHTRAATQGRPENPLNNHPIRYENVIGIHNGMVRNDDDLFELMGWERKGQVDSEAIFASIHHNPVLKDGLEAIDAGWAIAWINQQIEPRTLWLARGRTNPLFFGRTKAGSTVFASTKSAVEAAFRAGGINVDPKENYVVEAAQGFLACVGVDGKMEEFDKFDYNGLHAVSKPRTYVTHYGGGWDGDTDWERAAADFAASGGGGTPGKAATHTAPHPRSGGGGTLVPNGTERTRHEVGYGLIKEIMINGTWHRRAVQNNGTALPAAEHDNVVDIDKPHFRTPERGDVSKIAQEGDRIEMRVRTSIRTADETTFTGTVLSVGEHTAAVEWDACSIPLGAPYSIIGQLAQTGA